MEATFLIPIGKENGSYYKIPIKSYKWFYGLQQKSLTLCWRPLMAGIAALSKTSLWSPGKAEN